MIGAERIQNISQFILTKVILKRNFFVRAVTTKWRAMKINHKDNALNNKCAYLTLYEGVVKKESNPNRRTILEHLVEKGCDFCSGDYTECKDYSPEWAVREKWL